MRSLLLALLVACTPEPVDAPDAGVRDLARNGNAYHDAAPDVCWTYKTYQCGNELLLICVPPDGCGYFRCRGHKYGYCRFPE